MRVGREGTDGKYFAEHCAGARERRSHEVIVAPEVDAIHEETEDNGQVSGALVAIILLFEGADKRIREIWRRQLNPMRIRCVIAKCVEMWEEISESSEGVS